MRSDGRLSGKGKPMNIVARTVVVVSFAVLLSSGARADVIHVPSEAATIGQALSMAVDGDVVLLGPGTYAPAVVIDGKSVSLVGDGGGVKLSRLTVSHLPPGAVVLLQNLSMSPALGDSGEGLLCTDSEGA